MPQLKPLSMLLILAVTSACVPDSTVPAVSDYCAIAKPITYDSVNDTAETVSEIEKHNSKFVCVCEHDCPTTVKTDGK